MPRFIDINQSLSSSAADDACAAIGAQRVINVAGFGATGDGVTDDTAAFRSAFTAATNVSVHIPDGTYRISGIIEKVGGRLRIYGSAGAVIKPTNNYSTTPSAYSSEPAMIIHVNPVETHIENLVIDGNSTAINAGNAFPDITNNIHGISVYTQDDAIGDAAKVTIRDCHIKNFPCSGISITGPANVRVVDNLIEDGECHGVAVSRSTGSPGGYAHIRGNRVIGRGDLGEDTSRGGIGILVVKYDKVVISENFITDSPDTGTKTDGCNDVVYRGNIVIDSGKDGIKVQERVLSPPADPVYSVKRAVVEGNIVNRINDWRTDGGGLVILQNVSHAVVGNNILVGGGSRVATAIFAAKAAANDYPEIGEFTITGNVALDELNAGIDIRTNGYDTDRTAANVTISNNQLAGHITLAGAASGNISINGNAVNRYDGNIKASVACVTVNAMSSGVLHVTDNVLSDHTFGVVAILGAAAAVDTIRFSSNTMRHLNERAFTVDSLVSGPASLQSLDIDHNIVTDPTAGGATVSAPWRLALANLTIRNARIVNNTFRSDSSSGTYSFPGQVTGTPAVAINRLDVVNNIYDGAYTNTYIGTLTIGTHVTRMLGWPWSAAPVAGTWERGDRIDNSSPSELGSAASKYVIGGWRCVTAGTPGTWVQERSLTGN